MLGLPDNVLDEEENKQQRKLIRPKFGALETLIKWINSQIYKLPKLNQNCLPKETKSEYASKE